MTKDILGISVASIGWNDAAVYLREILSARRFMKVTFLNAHNANVSVKDREFATALGDFLVLPDGIGVDIAARVLYGEAFPANLNGTDFIPDFLRSTSEPLTVGLIGASRHNAEVATARLTELAPQHRFVLFHDGYFTDAEEADILERMAADRPDMLLVAMGVPRQELWIARRLTDRHCTMPVAVGALLDFMSGAVPRAPLWMRRLRQEWLFRLMIEPARLWRRYVVGNPLFLVRVLRQRLRGGTRK